MTKALMLLAAARAMIGTPYQLGGRDWEKGVDCQGLVFLAAETVKSCSWRSYSVYPTRTLKWQELGAPVPGASPAPTAALDESLLREGDHVMLLHEAENPAEPRPRADRRLRKVAPWPEPLLFLPALLPLVVGVTIRIGNRRRSA